MLYGVVPSLAQMMISQVPRSFGPGVQLRTLLVCQLAAVTSGIQDGAPGRRRKSAYRTDDGAPPLVLTVQVKAEPYAPGDGLAGQFRLRGVTTCTVPAL